MSSHFAQRCRERGIVETDADRLFAELTHMIGRADAGEEVSAVQKVLETSEGRFWRFRVKEGIFYAVTSPTGHRPMTIYTQRMMKNRKRAEKVKKRNLPFQVKDGPKGSRKPRGRRESGRNWRDEVP